MTGGAVEYRDAIGILFCQLGRNVSSFCAQPFLRMVKAISDYMSAALANRKSRFSLVQRPRMWRHWIACMVALQGVDSTWGASSRFETGGGVPLQTAVEEAVLAAESARLLFEFAFATDEVPAPGSFLDSVAFTLQTGNSSSTAILLTMDASGLSIAPSTPGGVTINPAMLLVTPVAFFGSAGDPTMRSAYAVSFDVPAEFLGGANHFYFDLFDNGDSVRSAGYFQNLVVVPEPSLAWLLLAGLTTVAAFKRFRFRK